ncbi:MAG: M20 family metallopeptidase [Oscillospiraceae bacterium]|jgi:amidohydrolase|nr:M20 family metallopeptidase [Oscillospiraceae bacterium]
MSIRDSVVSYIDAVGHEYQQIAREIHAKPELSNYEFFACERLSSQLRNKGFEVKVDVGGHRTGFTAVYKSGKPGPVVAYLAEYDALAGLGHGCGHNLFGATSSLAGDALKQVIDQAGGEVRVYGAPGEEGGENGAAKANYVREGFFKDVDAALCVHPGADEHGTTTDALAIDCVYIEFWGKSAHAAGSPELGINALDALILTYNGINALRQHVTPDVRMHGVITNGGKAPNSVPDYAKANFYLRAAKSATLDEVYAKVERIVEGAALMTGAKGKIERYQPRCEDMIKTPSLDALYKKNLELLGETVSPPPDKPGGFGSTDVGNVSHVVPTIHPHIRITDRPVPGHSVEMMEASCSESGLASILLGAKVLAFVALDLIEDPALMASIKEEHARAAGLIN